MAGFGGTVKLTGEQAYRAALQAIAADLQKVAAQQKLTSATYDKTDNSLAALSKRSEDLQNKLASQQEKVKTLTAALKDYQTQQEKNKTTIQNLQGQLDKEKSKLEAIAKQYGTNSKEYQEQAKVVDKLEQELKELNSQYEKNETTIKKTQAQLTSTEADIKKTTTAIDKLGKEADEAGKDVKDLGDNTKDSGNHAKNASEGFTVLKGALANLAADAIRLAINGLKKMGAVLVDTGKQALQSYAEYEQLVGGVETLFKDSAGTVQEYAEIAYKTAGMSANEYMSTVTSFSASLLQGLGGDTAKAAKIADMAIIDMSDNANKMGTSMEMIQNAYQGFAKDNFTMLDNLKLGYGGTQSEMARLINETGVMGKAFKATAQNVKDVPFDKMIEAIHKVQQNMGITGTTALEASETIEGSVNSMKASWKNLLVAVADNNADMSEAVQKFVDSTKTAAKNLIPRIKQIMQGFKDLARALVSEVFPQLKREVPELKVIIEPLEWIINNKDLVINGLKAMIAAFAFTKIMQFTKSISDSASAILAMTGITQGATVATAGLAGAQGAATTATGLGTAAVKLFNAAWAANPIGLVVTALALLVGGIIAVTNALDDNSESTETTAQAIKRQRKEIDEAKTSWDELTKAQKESLDKGLSEMSYYEDLANELRTITDENGKVRDGYEKRAQFITTTLADALGVEIRLQDGVVQGYDKIQSSIDKTIEKKKAEIILNAQEAAYTEAIEKRAEALQRQAEIEQQRTDAYAEQKAAMENYQQSLESFDIFWQQSAEDRYQRALKEVSDLNKQHEDQKAIIENYAWTISQYENNMALFHEEKYGEMTQISWDYIDELGNVEKAKAEQIQQDIKNEEKWISTLEGMRNDANKEMIDAQIEAAKKRQKNLQDQMAQYNRTTDNELKNNNKSWLDNAATVLSKLSDKKIEFKKVGEGQVQWYEDGMAVGKPMAEKEAEQIAKDTLAEFDKKAEAEGAGKDTITGFTNGEGNLSLQNAAFATARKFATNILSTLKSKLGINSPSKETDEMGRFLVKGLGVGIEKEEDKVIDQAEAFGENVLDALNGALDQGISTNALQALQTAIPSEFNANIGTNTSRMAEVAQSADKSLIGQFKQALSEMKIEMDDREMGKFVDKTVTDLVYN